MRKFCCTLFCALGLLSSAHAQTATDLNAGLRVVEGTATDTYNAQWWGIGSHAYVLTYSDDLETWLFDDQVYVGQDAILTSADSVLIQNDDDKLFWLVRRSPEALAEPLAWDPDGDHVGVADELNQGTSPFGWASLDGDFLPDDWQSFYGVAGLDVFEDPDLDGLLTFEEFEAGSDPLETAPLTPPVFNQAGGNFIGPQSFTLDNPNDNGEIRYTLDGSEPTSLSALYSGSINIDNGVVTVKARVFDFLRRSETSSEIYSVRFSADPPQAVYFGYIAETQGGFTYPAEAYQATTTGFIGNKYLSLGEGWLDGDGKFLPDESQFITPQTIFRVSAIINTGLSTAPQVVIYGLSYSQGANLFSASEKMVVTDGWLRDIGEFKTHIDYQNPPTVYFGNKLFTATGLGKFYSTSASAFASNDRIELGKGWVTQIESVDVDESGNPTQGGEFTETFTPDQTAPAEDIYLGTLASDQATPLVFLSHSSSSFNTSQRVYIGKGWLTNVNKFGSMIPDLTYQDFSNVLYGRKATGQSPINEMVFADAASNTLQNPISLGSGFIASNGEFYPATGTAAKDVWTGTRFFGGQITLITHSYTQSDLQNNILRHYVGKGWIIGLFGQTIFISEQEAALDTDEDGLTTFDEILVHHTNPFERDTDNDLLSDGDEVASLSFNPRMKNDPLADDDGDSLTNIEEFVLGGDPASDDGDEDGFTDLAEAIAGTRPDDPLDNINTPGYKASDVVELEFSIGDHSGSHSERYAISVTRDSDGKEVARIESPTFGEQVTMRSRNFRIGETYTGRILHLASNLESPDYDYTASITASSSSPNSLFQLQIVDNQVDQFGLPIDDVLGVHDESTENYADGKLLLIIPTGAVFEADEGKIHHGFDPPNAAENDPVDEYWASVTKGGTNDVINLLLPNAATAGDYELRISQADQAYVDVSPKTFTQASTSLTITGLDDGTEIIFEPVIELYNSETDMVVAKLNVMVLDQVSLEVGVYAVEDQSSPLTQFDVEPIVTRPTTQETIVALDDAYKQAGVTFTAHPSSGLKNLPYDTRTMVFDADGLPIWGIGDGTYESEPGPDGRFTRVELNAFTQQELDAIFPGNIRTIYVKKGYFPYTPLTDTGKKYTIRGLATGFAILTGDHADHTSYALPVFAHEIGHKLLLSTADEGSGGHDEPPHSPQIYQNLKNLPAEYPGPPHKIVPNYVLMQGAEPPADPQGDQFLSWVIGTWMRHEDWKRANQQARIEANNQ